MMDRKSVVPFLLEHSKKKPISFHMPGHKGARIYRENGFGEVLDQILDMDITEIPGADNLFQTEGIIRETMNRYRRLYNSKESYLIINGSSAGLISAIMTAVPKGGKLIMASNCHKSIYNGLSMIEGHPVYVKPTLIEEYGISGEILTKDIELAIESNPDSSAVLIPSPNYYGICSDIKKIAEVCHKHGKILIVDQAHGAHLKFFDEYIEGKKLSAENLGADIVINSTHKTLASMTQSAIVNICTDRVDKYAFEDKLQLVESTSPSYVLMASLDMNAILLEEKGEKLIRGWQENVDFFYEASREIPGLKVMDDPMLDRTKINLDMSNYGIDGIELAELLMEKNIYVELETGNISMCMTGIGNRRCDMEALIKALKEIAKGREIVTDGAGSENFVLERSLQFAGVPKEKERIPLEECAGRVCAFSLIPYPPGIPMVCPGEVIDGESLEYLLKLRSRGINVVGIDDQGRVQVGKE